MDKRYRCKGQTAVKLITVRDIGAQNSAHLGELDTYRVCVFKRAS